MKETWKPVTISGMTGILMGAGTMFASQKLSSDEMPVVESSEKPLLEASVEGSQSFREAFQAARAELGPGSVFRWHGNIYNTYTAEEWNAMSAEEKNLFAQRVKPEVSPADIDTNEIAETESASAADVQVVSDQQETDAIEEVPQETVAVVKSEESELTDVDVQIVPDQQETDALSEKAKVTASVTNTDDDDVRVIGYGDIDLNDGRSIAVEELEINGQRVAVIDVDKDGVGDFAMSDLNHNQLADNGEVIDLHTGGVVSFNSEQTSMEDLAADADLNMMPV